MTGYDLYIFIVCLVSFFSILLLFGVMLALIIRNEVVSINRGYMDSVLIDEYAKRKESMEEKKKGLGAFQSIFLAFTVVILALFGLTFAVHFADPMVEGSVPVPRVVLSDSMSYKHKQNDYLEKNALDDQFATFDLILTRELPDEFDLEVHDIVVYELRGELIVHRIVGIEEPNASHPDHRLFQMRGDANRYSDPDPVEYSQMRAIYKGERIPYVGSFIAFLQSPSGYLCIFLVIVGFIVAPIIEKYLEKKKLLRIKQLGFYSYW